MTLLLALTWTLAPVSVTAPFVDGQFRGRIAYSCDGNHNDPDDWAASPVVLGILAETGLKRHLVHFDYNCILPKTNPDFEAKHAAGILGAIEHYGYDQSVFHDCRKNLDAAVASLCRAIEASSAEDPLYFIIAGPVEVPVLGIQRADPAKRQHVYCISHSSWNDGYSKKYTFTHTKRSVIELGVRWVQIQDQNALLSRSPYGRPATPEEFRDFFWMRESHDPKVRFLWERMLVSTRPDPSDAGMVYFLATGDEQADPDKLRRLLEDKIKPQPTAFRTRVRLEAENFRQLLGFAVEFTGDKSLSQRMCVSPTGEPFAELRTTFDEPYTLPRGRYDMDVRYFDGSDNGQLSLHINGKPGGAWKTSGTNHGWTTRTISNVEIGIGEEIVIRSTAAPTKIDYVQLNLIDR